MSKDVKDYSVGKGVILMLLSSFFFASMQIAIRKTSAEIPLMEQIFFRNIIVILMCIPVIRINSGKIYLGTKKQQPLLFLRSIFGLLGLVAMFYASGHGIQADVTILMKLSPFLITIWAAIFLKEKIAKIQVPALILAFAGAFIVANPVFQTDMKPLIMAIICAVFSSFAYTLLAYSKDKADGMVVVMHFSVVCVVATLPFMIFTGFVLPDFSTLIMLIVIGIFGGLGQIALTYSYRYAPAGEVSVYNYSGIIFSMFLGYGFLGEDFTGRALIGGALVIAASILTYLFSESRVKK